MHLTGLSHVPLTRIMTCEFYHYRLGGQDVVGIPYHLAKGMPTKKHSTSLYDVVAEKKCQRCSDAKVECRLPAPDKVGRCWRCSVLKKGCTLSRNYAQVKKLSVGAASTNGSLSPTKKRKYAASHRTSPSDLDSLSPSPPYRKRASKKLKKL